MGCVWRCLRVCVCGCVCVCACLCTCASVRLRLYVVARISVCITLLNRCISVCVCVCVCMHACICLRSPTLPHTHTHTKASHTHLTLAETRHISYTGHAYHLGTRDHSTWHLVCQFVTTHLAIEPTWSTQFRFQESTSTDFPFRKSQASSSYTHSCPCTGYIDGGWYKTGTSVCTVWSASSSYICILWTMLYSDVCNIV